MLDNTYQTIMEPQKLAKSIDKFYSLPLKYNSVFDDPIIVQVINHKSLRTKWTIKTFILTWHATQMMMSSWLI